MRGLGIVLNQFIDNITLPAGLQSLTFDACFKQFEIRREEINDAAVSQQCHQVLLYAVHARLSQQNFILGIRTNLGKDDVSLSGLSAIIAVAPDAEIKGNSARHQIMTVMCWRAYLIV